MTYVTLYKDDYTDISIHTALAGCDLAHGREAVHDAISIHTALAGCDALADKVMTKLLEFQSTQPSQAVTKVCSTSGHPCKDFNPHSPRRL